MARSNNNILTKGLSGMVGKQIVFRSWNGKTFISVAPKKIEALDLTTYFGKADEEIKVTASKKDFELQEVEVIIVNEHGEIVEEGKTSKGLVNEWIYRTNSNMVSRDTARFIVRVKERTGNIKEKSFTL